MIQITNLVKSFGNHKVLKDLSINITNNKSGLIYGFLGKNGAGKTTTMNILVGLSRFDSGECVVNGTKINNKRRTFIESIGYLPESPGLHSYMTAYEYLHYLCNLFMDSTIASVRAEELLDLSGLSSSRDRKIGGFSRGMKQRLGIVGTLAHNPKLIFLDEPTSALDPEGRYQVLALLEKLKDQGKVIFLSTHLLDDVERICDRVGILDDGRLVKEGSIEDLLNNEVGHTYNIEIKESNQLERLAKEIEAMQKTNKITIKNSKLQVTFNDENDYKSLLNHLLTNSYTLVDFSKHKTKLEDVFLSIYRGEKQ